MSGRDQWRLPLAKPQDMKLLPWRTGAVDTPPVHLLSPAAFAMHKRKTGDLVVEKEEFHIKPSACALSWSREGIVATESTGFKSHFHNLLNRCLTLPALVA